MEEILDLSAEEDRILTIQATNMADYRRGIRRFVHDVWSLNPQPVRPEFKEEWETVMRASHANWERMKGIVKPEWFGRFNSETKGWEWYSPDGWILSREDFVSRKLYTWQQHLFLLGVEKAMNGDGAHKLSAVSGHGVGKTATCSWIILWYLYCFLDAQVPVTAPTSSQMHDALWKELSVWITRMPEDIKELYEWQHDYVRMRYSPESWFARARTSTKENTEAIAGIHAEHVAIVVDEASGVPEQVFITAQGALTSGKVLVVMISNGTRTIGYFFDSHHNDKGDFQCFQFNGEESPVVDKRFVADMEHRYGKGSEEYTIRVAGGFPGEDMMDDSGYLQLIPEQRILVRARGDLDIPFLGRKILGVDPSGEGKDRATYVIRDRFKAALVHSRQTTNDHEIAEDILTLCDRYDVKPEDVVVGAFGSGADVGKYVAIATAQFKPPWNIYTVMEGNAPVTEERYNGQRFRRTPDELVDPEGGKNPGKITGNNPIEYTDLFLNIRALMYFRARKWLLAGGQLVDESVDNSEFKAELVVIRYKRMLQGNRIQLMSKKEMLKLRIPSPNIADAFALTLLRNMDDAHIPTQDEIEAAARAETMSEDERFSSV